MRCREFVFISILAVLLVLAGCAKAECKKDVDCVKPHFTAKCIEKKCVFAPILNECGNGICETKANENKCVCAADCGPCEGTSGKYLVQRCNVQNECVEDIPATQQKPITQTRELAVSGTKISVTTTFNQPFNTKKDQIELDFGMNVLGSGMSELKISRLELTGMTPDKRTISLSDKTVNKYIYTEGSKFKERLIIDFPAAERDGELTNLNLKIYVDYILTSGTSVLPKSTTIQHPYQALKFLWTRPEKSPGCPASCDDANPGTQDVCGPETKFFCENRPIPGACGNNICEGSENKCTCAQDCGPCSGAVGSFLTRSCVGANCITQLKPGIATQPQSLFDDRDLGPFHLQNSYKYNKPFNIKTDKFALEFSLYQKQDTVTSIKLKDARILEGTQEITYAKLDKELKDVGQKQTAEMTIPAFGGSQEQERNPVLHIWYEYVEGSQTKQGDYTKSIGKLTLLNPDV